MLTHVDISFMTGWQHALQFVQASVGPAALPKFMHAAPGPGATYMQHPDTRFASILAVLPNLMVRQL